MKVLHVLILVALLLFGAANNGFCEKRDKEGHVSAIQSRVFHHNHEINLGFGYIANDDFYNVFPLSLGYTLHFNELFAWEVARGHYIINREKDLKQDLEEKFGVTPSVIREPRYAVHSHIVLKPLYGKDIFRDRTVINHETYLFAGGGAVIYEKQFSVGDSENEIAPSVSLGIGQKTFINKKFALNIELRDWVNFRGDKTINNFWFGFSLGYRFNLSARKAEKDETMEKLKKYLR